MKLIKKEKTPRNRNPHYKYSMTFMEGDADEYQTESIEFTENEIEKYKYFILTFETLCKFKDRDNYIKSAEYGVFFNPYMLYEQIEFGIFEFLDPNCELTDEEFNQKILEYRKSLNPFNIYLKHPSDSSYCKTRFKRSSLIFIDENGDETDVKIQIESEDLDFVNRILEADE